MIAGQKLDALAALLFKMSVGMVLFAALIYSFGLRPETPPATNILEFAVAPRHMRVGGVSMGFAAWTQMALAYQLLLRGARSKSQLASKTLETT